MDFPVNPTGGGTGGVLAGTAGGGATGVAAGIGGGTFGGLPTTTGGVGGPVTGGIGGPVTEGLNIPCDVQKILKDKCQVCHSDPPVGAPAALTKLSHFSVPAGSMPSQTMAQRAAARIADAKNPMPPIGRPALTAAEKSTLGTWLAGGAKGNPAACTTTTPPSTGGTATATGGTGGTGGPGGPVVAADCEMVQELRAHGGQGESDTTPFTAPTGGDHYEMFWFKPAWTTKMHAIDIQPIIDNGAVLHHWLLYMKDSGSESPGSHASDLGLQSGDSQLLSGWAPGNKGFVNPPDVGMYMVQGPSGRFGIELHYNTSANPPDRKDRSGARICATKPRPKEAGTHWLGTEIILFTDSVSSNCTVPKEAHILAHSPHMHKQGKHMKSIIKRKNGQTQVLTDQSFAFTDQQIYPVDDPSGEIVVGVGDVITTTCEWNTLVTFGPGTDAEMCYNFVVAYPNGALSTGTGLVGGKNTCMN